MSAGTLTATVWTGDHRRTAGDVLDLDVGDVRLACGEELRPGERVRLELVGRDFRYGAAGVVRGREDDALSVSVLRWDGMSALRVREMRRREV